MKKMIKFPSIDQFRTVVTNINRQFSFVGLNDDGVAIYDPSLDKPILKFTGSIKLHGTNVGVSFNTESGLWAQSRENIITTEEDNAGFAFFVESHTEQFMSLINDIKHRTGIDTTKNTISIYGEWCGVGIQKGVGISNIPKSFFIFGVKISPIVDNDEDLKNNPAYWVDHTYLKCKESNIYNINDFETYEIEIDFNVPQLSQNKLSEITDVVEKECPVAKEFGFNGIGEGVVWCCEYKGVRYLFKVKGEKHANGSKPKTLKKVDDEKIRLLLDIADKVTPIWRLEQMLNQACDIINGGQIDRSKLGNYIRMVINDVVKEDSDIISDAGLEPKDINKYVSEIAKKYFFEQELV